MAVQRWHNQARMSISVPTILSSSSHQLLCKALAIQIHPEMAYDQCLQVCAVCISIRIAIYAALPSTTYNVNLALQHTFHSYPELHWWSYLYCSPSSPSTVYHQVARVPLWLLKPLCQIFYSSSPICHLLAFTSALIELIFRLPLALGRTSSSYSTLSCTPRAEALRSTGKA